MFTITLADSLFTSTVNTKEIHEYNRLSVNLKALNKKNEDVRDCYLSWEIVISSLLVMILVMLSRRAIKISWATFICGRPQKKIFSTNSQVCSLYGVQWLQFIFMQNVLPSRCVILWLNFLRGCIPIVSGTAYLLKYPLCFIDFQIIIHLLVLVLQTGSVLPFLTFSQPEPNLLLVFSGKRNE